MADTTTIAIAPRHSVLGFYGVPGENGTFTFHRMKKFTQFSHSKNPIEYGRQYVDEPFQQTDVVGFSPQYDYAFDKHTGLAVHGDIISITDNENVGDDAVRPIIQVDTVTGKAIRRDYAVIPGSEGDNVNAYTYSGSMKAHGDKIIGTAASTDNWQTCTFTEGDT